MEGFERPTGIDGLGSPMPSIWECNRENGECAGLGRWPCIRRCSEKQNVQLFKTCPTRRRLPRNECTSFEIAPFPQAANCLRRGTNDFHRARLCAYLVKAKVAYRDHLDEALGHGFSRPLSREDYFKKRYWQRFLLRSRNDFLAEYWRQANQLETIPVRRDEIALWDEWQNSAHGDVIDTYRHRCRKKIPWAGKQGNRLRRFCGIVVPDIVDAIEGYRTLCAFSSGYCTTHIMRTCAVCLLWDVNGEAAHDCVSGEVLPISKCKGGYIVPVHTCQMGKTEYVHQMELLELTHKFFWRILRGKHTAKF